MDQRLIAALVAVLAIVVVAAIAAKRHRERDGFASDGGPSGRLLIGGDVVRHNMESDFFSQNPCCTHRERFEPQTWDERSNFEPNPNPKKALPELSFGLDLMGVPRKFDVHSICR